MKINEEIEKVQKKIDDLKLQLAIEQAVLERLQGLTVRKRRSPRKRSVAPRKDSLAAHLEKILRVAERSLSVSELAEMLKKNGFKSSANTPLNNLIPSAMSRRSDIFIRLRHGVYDLKERHKETSQIE
jgi:hypothetical protein